MADYQVNITLDDPTLQALVAQNFYLYGFKAVQTSQGGGAPTVWFKTNNFAPTVSVNWTEEYQSYVSNSEISQNTTIVASGDTKIDLGQTWQVNKVGTGPVVSSGPKTAISILNTDSKPWTTGISQKGADGKFNSLCAFPLNGNGLDVIAPIQKVLLMFATNQVNTGTVIYQAFTASILIDLTSANQRAVAFNINNAWSWGNFGWAQQLQASTNIVPFLIENDTFNPNLPAVGSGRKGSFRRSSLVAR